MNVFMFNFMFQWDCHSVSCASLILYELKIKLLHVSQKARSDNTCISFPHVS